MSFFRGFFGALFGIIFAIWLLQLFDSSTFRFRLSSLDLYDRYTDIASTENKWTFDKEAFDLIHGELNDGSCAMTGNDSAEAITIEARIEAHAMSKLRSQEYLGQTLALARQDLKNKKIILSIKEPSFVHNANIKVNWNITCPKNIALALNSHNGQVMVKNMESKVDISTERGTIEAIMPHIRKSVTFKTKNGRIELDLGAFHEEATVLAETKNGMIALQLPHASSYTISANTKCGAIKSMFPIYSNTPVKDAQITLDTKNGPITISESI